jgi:putative ABC transport system substrate-binding protein
VTGYSRRHVLQGAGSVSLGLLAGCGRLPWQAEARAPSKLHRIGLLALTERQANLDAFREGLREAGYVEGHNIALDARYAAGREESLPDLAAEVVGLRPDVIIAGAGSPFVVAAKNATTIIPIVMVNVVDPVELGLVESLARPGGNVTGVTSMAATLAGKRLELLKETLPGLLMVAVLWHDGRPSSALNWAATSDAAQQLGIHLQPLRVREPADLESAFEAAASQHAEAVSVIPDPLFAAEARHTAAYATRYRLPTVGGDRGNAEAGGLLAYGANVPSMYRRAAYYVDRILKGTKPADLPVEQPTRFDFVINVRTAQALDLTIPHHVLLQATEVIQ